MSGLSFQCSITPVSYKHFLFWNNFCVFVEGFDSFSLILAIMLPAAVPCPRGFAKDDIHFARFYKAATQTTKQALKEIFVLIFYRAGVHPVETWSTSVIEFCVQILGWSNRKIRDTFFANERVKIEEPLVSADFDVSLLAKLYHKLFEDLKLPDSMERAIRNIKNVRNRVCHEQFSMDETNLRENLEDLRDMLGNLFDGASKFLDIDLKDKKYHYFDEINDIQSSPITDQAISYFETVETFREELVGKFITHGRKELMIFFSKLKVLNPFTWLSDDKFPELVVDKIFTPLYIHEQERVIDVSTLLVTELFSESTHVSLGILPAVLILSGVAGCGKTSLCRYILHIWRTRTARIEGLRSVDILILIELRNVSESSLVAYLQKTLLRKTCSYFEEKDILLTLQNMNVLFLIDGMDEASENGKNLVEEIFSTLGTARVIITSRPEFTSTITHAASRHHHSQLSLCIKGFTQEGMRNFIYNILACYETDTAKCHDMYMEFSSFLKLKGTAFSDHLHLPLTLALLFILWKDDKSRVSKIMSSTQLYNEIFRQCSLKLITRLKPLNSLHHLEIENIISEWLLVLAEKAFEMLDDGQFIIQSAKTLQLTSFCRKHGIDSVQTLSAFLLCEVKEAATGIDYCFSFMHKSQMEYLASLFLVRRMSQESNIKILKNLPTILRDPLMLKLREIRWWNTVLFTLGHLCREKSVSNETLTEIVRILLKPDNHGSSVTGLWRIIQESECHPLVCDLVSSSINKELIWKPDSESLCDPVHPMMLLLKNTRVTPKGVLIRILGSSSQSTVAIKGSDRKVRPYVNLLPLLRCLSQRPATNVCIRMDQLYFEWGNPENSDEILAVLLEGGTLTAFMGHLGVKGAGILSKAKNLGEVYIRISNLEALQAFSKSLLFHKIKVQMLTLRLDIPCTETTGFSIGMESPLNMSVILRNVNDVNEALAADMVSSLRRSYLELDLVASNLTFEGGFQFVRRLVENGIQVSRKITIRTCHRIENNEYQQLSKKVECTLEWLW